MCSSNFYCSSVTGLYVMVTHKHVCMHAWKHTHTHTHAHTHTHTRTRTHTLRGKSQTFHTHTKKMFLALYSYNSKAIRDITIEHTQLADLLTKCLRSYTTNYNRLKYWRSMLQKHFEQAGFFVTLYPNLLRTAHIITM